MKKSTGPKHTLCYFLSTVLLFFSFSVFAQIPEKAYAKFDFIPGDKVLFEDNFLNESTDEIPSYWIVGRGKVEVTKINGELVMGLLENPSVYPRQKEKNIYPDRITLEFDYLWRNNSKTWEKAWKDGNVAGGEYIEIRFANDKDYYENASVKTLLGDFYNDLKITSGGEVSFMSFNAEYNMGEKIADTDKLFADLNDKWVHVSIAINEKSVKVYLNSQRVLNAPISGGKISTFQFISNANNYEYGSQVYIKNVRIAKGGADPYKQLMAEGKIIARGINFDVAKSTIKPESLGSLNTIVTLMKEHPELKFEIAGHTDSDGDDASNMKLSQERADAVRTKLISMGIDAARLTSKGYGETKPISPNTSVEGKANNRRVELIKKS